MKPLVAFGLLSFGAASLAGLSAGAKVSSSASGARAPREAAASAHPTIDATSDFGRPCVQQYGSPTIR